MAPSICDLNGDFGPGSQGRCIYCRKYLPVQNQLSRESACRYYNTLIQNKCKADLGLNT
jgi:hypothetical protein